MAAKKRKEGHIAKFLKRADKAIDEAIDQGIKRADEVLEDAVEFGKIATAEARKKSDEIREIANREKEKLKTEGERKITKGIATAKKISADADEDLAILEKLGKLRKAGVITEKEFQEKKKKILARI